MTDNDINYGLALSGGGARGIIHLGVLQALIDNNIKISAISGTSMGAIVGAFFAMGVEPNKVLEIIVQESESVRILKPLAHFKHITGFFDIPLLGEQLHRFCKADNFSSLKIPLYISVSNITTGENEIISWGRLIDYVIASASIPVIFETKVINGNHYVDGGLTKNLAEAVLKGDCDKIIGDHANYITNNRQINGMKDVAERSFQLAIFNTIRDEFKYCDYIIDPPQARNYKIFDFKKAKEIFNVGYEEGVKFLERPD